MTTCCGKNNQAIKQQDSENMVRDSSCLDLPELMTKRIPCDYCAVARSTQLSTIGPLLLSYDEPLAMVVADLLGLFFFKTICDCKFALEIRDIYFLHTTKPICSRTIIKHQDSSRVKVLKLRG